MDRRSFLLLGFSIRFRVHRFTDIRVTNLLIVVICELFPSSILVLFPREKCSNDGKYEREEKPKMTEKQLL